MINHHPEKVFTVRTGNRIAQVAFMAEFNANFHRVSHQHLLGKKKRKQWFWIDMHYSNQKKFREMMIMTKTMIKQTSENQQVIFNSEDNQVTSEEAIMTVNKKVAVHEPLTIDG